MSNLLLLAICFILGMLLRRSGRFPENAPSALNGFIIHISLPALTLLHIHKLQPDPAYFYTAAMAWVLFALGLVFFGVVGKLLAWPAATVGALMLVGGLGNTSFVGLPMIAAWYGEEYLAVGIIADQVGSFAVLSTLGILVATWYSSGGVSARQMARKILLFPPFQALLLAALLRPLPLPPVAEEVLRALGATLVPLALVSVGFQLRLNEIRGLLQPLAVGLFFKLALGPLLILLLFVGVLGGEGPIVRITIFEAAMAPMITAGIIAVDHKLNPPLVTLMLGIGIPLSFATLAIWYLLLQGV